MKISERAKEIKRMLGARDGVMFSSNYNNNILRVIQFTIDELNQPSGLSPVIDKPDCVGQHYRKGIDPWKLQAFMESSGSAFIDARRCDAIKYAFRKKSDMLEDLKKSRHCLDAAIKHLEENTGS